MKAAKICGIYKITSPKGSVYIGQSNDINQRFYHYSVICCKHQIKLCRSLKKYGAENHKFEIIHICSPEESNDLEKYYICLFNSTNKINGLNLQFGGKGGSPSEETRAKISKSLMGRVSWNIGKIRTPEMKLKMSLAAKGRKMPEEQKKKISEANKGRILSPENIERFRKWSTARIVSAETRKKQGLVQMGHKRNLGKHHSEETKRKISEMNRDKLLKPCIQYFKDGTIVNEFKSVTEAFNITGIRHIGGCMSGKRKTAGGYIWVRKY